MNRESEPLRYPPRWSIRRKIEVGANGRQRWGDRQGHSAPVWCNPTVIAAAITVVGAVAAALIALAKTDSAPVIVLPTPTNAPARVPASSEAAASPELENLPAIGVPDQAVGRWRGGIGLTGYPVGESVGDFKIQLAGDAGTCAYRALLMSVDLDYIAFRTSKVKGGAFCAEWGTVRLEFDGHGRASVTEDGSLYRS